MDKQYWNNYYKDFSINTPSLFAQFIAKEYLKKEDRVLELGCGNGRDASYLGQYVKEFIAIDQAVETGQYKNIQFIQDDFTTLSPQKYGKFNLIYSRFTMHAIDYQSMLACFDYVQEHVAPNGLFVIEARGEKNELFGQGVPHSTEKNTFFLNGHHRRFLNKENTENELKKREFNILLSLEEKDFAPFGDENYHFLRIVASLI